MRKTQVFAYLFSTSSRHYKRAVNQELQKLDLTISQCGVIRALLHAGELTQAEIADIFSSDRATIGSVIEKLKEKEFLEKKVSSKDRRAYVIRLTPKARELADEIERISDGLAEKALSGLSDEEKLIFIKGLNTIIQNLSEG